MLFGHKPCGQQPGWQIRRIVVATDSLPLDCLPALCQEITLLADQRIEDLFLDPTVPGGFSCFQNLCMALSQLLVTPDQISTTLNIFMNVWADPGRAAHRSTDVEARRPLRPACRDGPACRPDRMLGGEVEWRHLQTDRLRNRPGVSPLLSRLLHSPADAALNLAGGLLALAFGRMALLRGERPQIATAAGKTQRRYGRSWPSHHVAGTFWVNNDWLTSVQGASKYVNRPSRSR